MPSLDAIAKTITGPNEAKHVGEGGLRELQDHRWGRLRAQEQAHIRRASEFIRRLFEQDPDGWVVLDTLDKRVRCIDQGIPEWTTDLDAALWFARRDDADRYSREDDDAWHIRRVCDVRAMWAAAPRSEGVPAPSTRALEQDPPIERALTGEGTPVPPHAPLLPVDTRSVTDLLRMFRAFVSRNVTQWAMGAGDHHHPIWQDIAGVIDDEDATFGPEWAYTSPRNRKEYVVLLAEYIDLRNEHEATERGG